MSGLGTFGERVRHSILNRIWRFVIGASALLTTTAVMADDRPPLLCGGVEPFWSLEIGSDVAVFATPDIEQIDYTIPHVAKAEGRAWPQVMTLLSQRDTALAIVRPMQCSDTMSDTRFDWMIDVLTQQKGEAIALTGCCRMRPAD